MDVMVNNAQHLFALLHRHLLSVARVGNWLVLIVLQLDVAKLAVRHVLHVDPLDPKSTLPFVNTVPDHRVIVDGRHHLRDAAEVATSVNTEIQVDRSLALALAVGSVQSLVAILSAAPFAVFDGATDIVLGVALNDKEPSRLRIEVKLLRVIKTRRRRWVRRRGPVRGGSSTGVGGVDALIVSDTR